MHRKTLNGCRVYLLAVEDTNQRLTMRWRSPGSQLATDETSLIDGELYLVPVAARNDKGEQPAVITTDRFLTQRKANLTAPVGRSHWRLQVEGEQKRWESLHTYVLHVPNPNRGNGHFTLEINYDRFDLG